MPDNILITRHFSFCAYFNFFPVLIPNGKYNGQKLTKLVNKNTTDKIINIIPITPVITLVKYNIMNAKAINVLITLSMVPIFFFIAAPKNNILKLIQFFCNSNSGDSPIGYCSCYLSVFLTYNVTNCENIRYICSHVLICNNISPLINNQIVFK